MRLDRLVVFSPLLQQASTLREALTTIFDTARSKTDGLRRIHCWRCRVAKSGLTCFVPCLKLLDARLNLMANSCIDRQTSSVVAGLNTTINRRKRRCSGLRNVVRLFQRLTGGVSSVQSVAEHSISWVSRQLLKSQKYILLTLFCQLRWQKSVSKEIFRSAEG